MTIIQQLLDLSDTKLKTQRSLAGVTIETVTDYKQYILIAIANSALAVAMKIYADNKDRTLGYPYIALIRHVNLMLDGNDRRPMTTFLMLSYLYSNWTDEQCLEGDTWLHNVPTQPLELDKLPIEFHLRCAYKAALSLLREADRYVLNTEYKGVCEKSNAKQAMDFASELTLRIRNEIVAPAIEANTEAVTALVNAGVYINNFELEDLLNDVRASNNEMLAKRLNKLTS